MIKNNNIITTKNILLIVSAFAILAGASLTTGCNNNSSSNDAEIIAATGENSTETIGGEAENDDEQFDDENGEDGDNADEVVVVESTIFACLPDGNTQEFAYSGEADPFKIAEKLSEFTGIPFDIDQIIEFDDGIEIDWNPESPLFSFSDKIGEGDFEFTEYEDLVAFMLDSMANSVRTICGCDNIYYTANDGETITLEKLDAYLPAGVNYSDISCLEYFSNQD